MEPAGTIFDLKKYAIHDGPGIRTTVFFAGCPLDCQWCHNPEGRRLKPVRGGPSVQESNPSVPATVNGVGCTVTAGYVLQEILKDRLFYDESGGGVTFSGGEPMMQIDFLSGLLERCRDEHINTAVDTSGYAPFEDFDRIYDLVDLWLYDLKVIDNELHRQYTGISNELILANLKALATKGGEVVIRLPMIPGITDTDENLSEVAELLGPLKNIRQISLLPYNKLGADKARRFRLNQDRYRWEPQSSEEMQKKKLWLESCGFDVKVGG